MRPALPTAVLAAILAAAPAAAATPDPGALLDRLTWGRDAAGTADLAREGTGRWLDGQLHPRGDDLPPAVAARVAALAPEPLLAVVRRVDDLNRAAQAIADPAARVEAKKVHRQALATLGRQAAERSLLRDLYARDQLREVMTWFWANHFNVHAGKRNVRAMVGDYEDTIRTHALGRFRDLLGSTLRHPAMLVYLDNAQNAAGRINENHARELMELHTLGVGAGYSQHDVEELARILTGVGIDARPDDPRVRPEHAGDLVRDGLFEFNPNRHDYGDKTFLGHRIAGRGLAEVDEALDILAAAPATAHHVSLALAREFVGDSPPPALVARMAATFTRTHGDIAEVMATMIGSREFTASLGTAFKDPAHYVLSAVRLGYADRVVTTAQPIAGWLGRLGEGLYDHQTPDGYPVGAAAWNGPGQLAARFEVARAIGGGAAALFRPDPPVAAGIVAAPSPVAPSPSAANPLAPTPPVLPPPVAPTPIPDLRGRVAALYPAPDAATAAALAQAASPAEFNTLFLSSPAFMRH